VVHLVTYDLKSPNNTAEDYQRVIAGLKSAYPNWCHLENSVWIVVAPDSATDVRDNLKPFLNSGDILFVGRLQGNWGSYNLGSKRSEWLKSCVF
jgi:hypothetical protein